MCFPDSDQQIETFSDLLPQLCQNRQLVCISKLSKRSEIAIQCVKLVIDALNRWSSHLASGNARHEVQKLKVKWFGSESSIIIILLLYCFDMNELIRAEAMSTLKAIGSFCSDLFLQDDTRNLVQDALSILKDLCNSPRLVADISWLQARYCGNFSRLLFRDPICQPVQSL
jgi:hypothetical protein